MSHLCRGHVVLLFFMAFSFVVGRPLMFPLKAEHSTFAPTSSSSHDFTLMADGAAVAALVGCPSVDFSAAVTINNQGPFSLIVDTGSTQLAVASTQCECGGVTPTLNTSAMTAIRGLHPSVKYADDTSWSGEAFSASVSIGDPYRGGSAAVDMRVASIEQSHHFSALAQCLSGNALRNFHQGIIGFAYEKPRDAATDDDDDANPNMWFSQYRRAMRIPNEFTIQLCPRSGNLWVGGYDTDFIAANEHWTYVKLKLDDPSHPHYNTFLHALAVGGTTLDANINDLGLCHDQARNKYCAVVDSGSTQMVFSSAVYSLVTEAIKRDENFQRLIGSRAAGAKFFSLTNPNCVRVDQTISREKLNANLPNLTFTFSSSEDGDDQPVTITVPAAYSYMAVFYDDREVEYYCNGIGDGGKSSTTLLGWAFMNTFTIRHDLDNSRLGFIKTENCGRTAPPLLSFNYSIGDWGSCTAKCGGGIQWRNVTCQYVNGSATDMQKCITNGPQPTRSLPCQLNSCTAVTQAYTQPPNTSTNVWRQGSEVSIAFAPPSEQVPTVILLESLLTRERHYVSRSALVSPHAFYVNASLPVGEYRLGLYNADPTAVIYGRNVSVEACSAGTCIADPCSAGSATCSLHGYCAVSGNTFVCDCIGGWSGAACNVAPASDCTLQCGNGGRMSLSPCACECPHNFAGLRCELRFAELRMQIANAAASQTQSSFRENFVVDVAYAAGTSADLVTLTNLTVSSDGKSTLVDFTITTPANSTVLRTQIEALTTQEARPRSSLTALSAGTATHNATLLSVISEPPPDTSTQVSPLVDFINKVVARIPRSVIAAVVALCIIATLFVLYAFTGRAEDTSPVIQAAPAVKSVRAPSTSSAAALDEDSMQLHTVEMDDIAVIHNSDAPNIARQSTTFSYQA